MIRATLDDYNEVKAICDREGARDPRDWLADPRNIILMEDDNLALFLWRWIGIYEGHVMFAKRGKLALDLGSYFLDVMFRCGAGMILAVAKPRQAKWFLRQLGFQSRGEIETIEGLGEMFQLEAAQWAL